MENPLQVDAEDIAKELASEVGSLRYQNARLTVAVKQLVEHGNALQEKLNAASETTKGASA